MSWLEALKKLRPATRVAAEDGMPVTSEIWADAHNHHAQLLHAHTLACHGWGIVGGLQAVADDGDPPRVLIKPGAAIDQSGRLIVVGNERALPLRTYTGTVYITLVYEETKHSHHRVNESYDLCASTQLPPKSNEPTYVELARIQRTSASAKVTPAANPARPTNDEIDPRFRLELGIGAPIQLAVVKVDPSVPDDHVRGWRQLAHEVSYLTSRAVHVQEWDAQSLPTPFSNLLPYAMLCLVGQDHFSLDQPRRQALYDYIRSGGLLFYEGCRQRARGKDPPDGDLLFRNWIKGLTTTDEFESVAVTDELMCQPFFFHKPPSGFDPGAQTKVEINRAIPRGLVLMSTGDYACAWAGVLRNNSTPRRNEVREALEWGHNLIAFAGRRR